MSYEEFNGNLTAFANSGKLRYVLERAEVPEEIIEKILNRC